MDVLRQREAILSETNRLKAQGKYIGFVPTMGALHEGHLDLVQQAKQENAVVVCSIFVNPVQFNDPSDYENYPVTIEEDLKKLKELSCNYVFIPDKGEIYPSGMKAEKVFDPGHISQTLEGAHRSGHFEGVVTVVNRFFELISPNKAYFGQKDYQQFLIIKALAAEKFPHIEVVMVPTRRETSGLAMSSRNRRLSDTDKALAIKLYEALSDIKSKYGNGKPAQSVNEVYEWLDAVPGIDIDYLSVRNANNLRPVENWDDAEQLVACGAVQINNVRLIDNILIP